MNELIVGLHNLIKLVRDQLTKGFLNFRHSIRTQLPNESPLFSNKCMVKASDQKESPAYTGLFIDVQVA
jgi:hypothetical protein